MRSKRHVSGRQVLIQSAAAALAAIGLGTRPASAHLPPASAQGAAARSSDDIPSNSTESDDADESTKGADEPSANQDNGNKKIKKGDSQDQAKKNEQAWDTMMKLNRDVHQLMTEWSPDRRATLKEFLDALSPYEKMLGDPRPARQIPDLDAAKVENMANRLAEMKSQIGEETESHARHQEQSNSQTSARATMTAAELLRRRANMPPVLLSVPKQQSPDPHLSDKTASNAKEQQDSKGK